MRAKGNGGCRVHTLGWRFDQIGLWLEGIGIVSEERRQVGLNLESFMNPVKNLLC